MLLLCFSSFWLASDQKKKFYFFNRRSDGSILNNDYVFNKRHCYRCLSGDVIISSASVCDGITDCPDQSDECLCQDHSSDICKHIVLDTAVYR